MNVDKKQRIYQDLVKKFTDRFLSELRRRGVNYQIRDLGYKKGRISLGFIDYDPSDEKLVNRLYNEYYARIMREYRDEYKEEIQSPSREQMR